MPSSRRRRRRLRRIDEGSETDASGEVDRIEVAVEGDRRRDPPPPRDQDDDLRSMNRFSVADYEPESVVLQQQIADLVDEYGQKNIRTYLKVLDYPERVINEIYHTLNIATDDSSTSQSDSSVPGGSKTSKEARTKPGRYQERFPTGGYGDLYSKARRANTVGRNLYLFDNELFQTYAKDINGDSVFSKKAKQRAHSEPEDPHEGMLTTGLESGLKYLFSTLHKVGRDGGLTSAEQVQEFADKFSPENLQELLSRCKNEELDQRQEVLHYDIIPVPTLLPPSDKNGWLSNRHRKDFREALANRRFSGDSSSKISCSDFLTELSYFCDNQLGPDAAYCLMKTYCEGKAQQFVRHCIDISASFNYAWQSFNRLFATSYQPMAAKRALLNLLDTRPTNLQDYFLRMIKLCKEASYDYPAELRSAWKIRQHREALENMLSTWYPAHKHNILKKEDMIRKSWTQERDRIRARGDDPDMEPSGVSYHSVLTLQDIITDELDKVVPLAEAPVSRRPIKHKVQAIEVEALEELAETEPLPMEGSSTYGDDLSTYGDGPHEEDGYPAKVEALGARPPRDRAVFEHKPRVAAPPFQRSKPAPSPRKDAGEVFKLCVKCGAVNSHEHAQCWIYKDPPAAERCSYCHNFHNGSCVRRQRDQEKKAKQPEKRVEEIAIQDD